jgi:hypothetical protein
MEGPSKPPVNSSADDFCAKIKVEVSHYEGRAKELMGIFLEGKQSSDMKSEKEMREEASRMTVECAAARGALLKLEQRIPAIVKQMEAVEKMVTRDVMPRV